MTVIRNALLILLPVILWAQEPSKPIGTVSSGKPLTIGGTAMSPTGASSWPVMERDELATQATTLFTTSDRNTVIFNSDTKARLDSLALTGGTTKQTYIFLRQGGLSFEAKTSRLYICAAGRLFVPEVQAIGVVKIESNGTVTQGVSRGAFAERGQRSCTESGIGNFLTGTPGAAGGAVAPNGGLSGTSITQMSIGAGVAVAAGIAAFFGNNGTTCATTGCNANPAPVSPSQP